MPSNMNDIKSQVITFRRANACNSRLNADTEYSFISKDIINIPVRFIFLKIYYNNIVNENLQRQSFTDVILEKEITYQVQVTLSVMDYPKKKTC